jgi:quercetin dioxygenase-like cupin family protein
MRRGVLLFLVCLGLCVTVVAQDAVKTDPKHYTVISENDQVRILKIHYGPHEKSIMHSHPASVVVYLSGGNVKFHMPDGKTMDVSGKPGEAMYAEGMSHNPENMSDQPMEAILVELKSKAPAKPGKAPAKKSDKKM